MSLRPRAVMRLAVLIGAAAMLHAGEVPVLTHIAEMRALSREQAGLHPAVRVQGVVTFKWRNGIQSFSIDDGVQGVWVSVSMAKREQVWKGDEAVLDALAEGTEVEIVGVMDPGGYSPDILPASVRVTGRRILPPARLASATRLMSGAEDSQRVEVAGVVQSCVSAQVGHWLLRVDIGSGHLLATISGDSALTPTRLVDAEVRLTGVAASSRNWRAEFICPRLLISSDADVRIVAPAPQDPFAVERVPIKDLATFSSAGRASHRRAIEGTVTYCERGAFLYLQDGACAVRVGSPSLEGFIPGDRVVASGFVDTSRAVAGLSEALVRRLSPGDPPAPVGTALKDIQAAFRSVRDLGRPASPHDYDGLLVSVSGRLLDIQRDLPEDGRRLVLDCAGALTTADLSASLGGDRSGELDALQPGSMLRVAGVAVVAYAPGDGVVDYTLPNRLDLLCRSSADVVVLSAPSWWTAQRLWAALAATLSILGASLAWSLAMRRLLRRRTQRLEEVMRTHRDSELEFKAAMQERQRLAADMHDGLQQLIAGATYRLEAAAAHLQAIPPAVQEQLSAARGALVRTQEGLRDCLWGLRHVDEGGRGFAALLEHAAASMDHWPAGAVAVSVTGTPFDLSRHVMGSLLMLMQEAVGNAFTHGKATRIQLILAYQPEVLAMRIEDDGGGFDPEAAPGTKLGHFGLESMRHRMVWLGGTVEIASRPGSGASVRISLPRARARAEDAATAAGGSSRAQ
jgi:signal transduction histidine kinase